MSPTSASHTVNRYQYNSGMPSQITGWLNRDSNGKFRISPNKALTIK